MSSHRTRWWPVAAAALGLLALAAWEHAEFSAGASRAAGDAVRGALACLALFGVCGYAPARLWVPPELRPHGPLIAFPLGAAVSAIVLAALGLAHVPFGVSLPLVLAAGAGSGIAVRARLGPWRDAGAGLLRPAYVAAVVAVVALSPVWRTGFSTVVGQNGDVVLAVGSAQLVKEAPPTAVRPELPIDRIPLVWRSKYPIFYSLAAVSELSGLSVVAAFPLVAAALLAMASFGFFLFARHVLRAPPWAALAAMAAVGLGRLPLHIVNHPFYNELWALFALPFILTAGACFLRAPSGASLALLAVFAAIGAFAYPLMLPFPVLFLAVWAWRERARVRPFLRRPDGPAWVWVPAAVAALAVFAVLVRGVVEKTASAAVALSPWGDLSAWSGTGLPHLPFHRAFGLIDPGGAVLVVLLLAVLLAAAAWGVWRSAPDARVPFAVTLVAALAAAALPRPPHAGRALLLQGDGDAGPAGGDRGRGRPGGRGAAPPASERGGRGGRGGARRGGGHEHAARAGSGPTTTRRATCWSSTTGRARCRRTRACASTSRPAATSCGRTTCSRRGACARCDRSSASSPTPSRAARPTTSSRSATSAARATPPARPCSPTPSSACGACARTCRVRMSARRG